MRTPQEIEKYQDNYSQNGLQRKIKAVARWAGAKVIYAVLLLYYVLQSPTISKADKSKIYGALGYFILPPDLIADFLPIAGYSDDLAALMIALHAVSSNITPEIKAQAKAKLSKWFGERAQKIIDGMI